MKKFLLAAAALALGVHGALALRAGPASNGWFRVTEPISACEAVDTFTPCDMRQLKVGDVFYVDPQDENVGNIAGLRTLWRPVCVHGCSPSMTPVLVSPGDWRSAFKPAKPPKGW